MDVVKAVKCSKACAKHAILTASRTGPQTTKHIDVHLFHHLALTVDASKLSSELIAILLEWGLIIIAVMTNATIL